MSDVEDSGKQKTTFNIQVAHTKLYLTEVTIEAGSVEEACAAALDETVSGADWEPDRHAEPENFIYWITQDDAAGTRVDVPHHLTEKFPMLSASEKIADSLVTMLQKARAALPDAWLAAKAEVPRDLIDEINSVLAEAGISEFDRHLNPSTQTRIAAGRNKFFRGETLRNDVNADLFAALKDLLGDRRNDKNGMCLHCGRDNEGHENDPCSEDCPGEIARQAIAKAESAS